MSENKSPCKYTCNICDYKTRNKKDYTKHLSTRKHIHRISLNDKSPKPTPVNNFECDICGRSFKARNSLWYHKKKCVGAELYQESTVEPGGSINTDVVMKLLTQNQEFKELMLDQSKQLLEQQEENKILQNKLLEAVKEGKTINNTTNNTTNNKFNLNFFLNEQCKDAMNISDFIDNMVLSVEDLKNTGRLGYIDGITKIFTDKLKEMDTYNRPMHCTDLKRETLYIKNNDEWDKDSDKNKMKTAIECVANKNLNNLNNWKEDNPNHVIMDSNEDKEFVEIMTNSLGGMGSEREKNKQKIIKNVLKEVVVDK
jgi:hypothetical protein